MVTNATANIRQPPLFAVERCFHGGASPGTIVVSPRAETVLFS